VTAFCRLEGKEDVVPREAGGGWHGPRPPPPPLRLELGDAIAVRFERFAGDVGAPGRARRSVVWLKTYLDLVPAYDLSLMVSELVTHAVLHAELGDDGDWIGVQGLVFAPCVRVEVSHSGVRRRLPPPRASSARDSAVEGFWFVQRLSDAWGVESDGALLWFELTR